MMAAAIGSGQPDASKGRWVIEFEYRGSPGVYGGERARIPKKVACGLCDDAKAGAFGAAIFAKLRRIMRMGNRWSVGLAILLALSAVAGAQGGSSAGNASSGKGDLQIYFVDVEGGQSTLFVMPSGESLLVDTGNPGGRDAARIVAVCKLAGVTKIDTLLVTHYHTRSEEHTSELQSLRH